MKHFSFVILFFVLSIGLTQAQEASISSEQYLKQIAEGIGGVNDKLERVISDDAPATSTNSVETNAIGAVTAYDFKLNLNYLWITVAAFMVFLMQGGFCLVELGMSRAKNSINILMKNVLDLSVAAVSFLFIGFALMYGTSMDGWIGKPSMWFTEVDGESPIWIFFLFQAVFVATANTIASGAMAERTKFVGYLCYTVILSALIYPLVGHWAWGSYAGAFTDSFGGDAGWLERLGFVDFAGSTVVHATGGACALAGIIVLGPRVGRFNPDGSPRLIVGHNLPFAVLGTFILWFGWFGFNAGSALEVTGAIGRICVNTLISGAAGALFAMASFWRIDGKPDIAITINGALGGLVAITACCHCINPVAAAIVGAIAGLIATFGALLLEKMKLDDVVGAVPVHLFNGIWGTLSVAVFNESGFRINQFGSQALGVTVIAMTAFCAAFVTFKLFDVLIGLRATDEEQEDGLDFAEHSANAYPDFQTTEQM